MKKITNPQTEQFESFEALVNAVETRYTLSLKDACKALKCSRSWVQNYVRPHVPSIYLQNGKGTNKANYARLVSSIINKRKLNLLNTYSNESIYLDEKAFNELIYSSITSCQKRSKKAYKSYFIQQDKIDTYYKHLLKLTLTLMNEHNDIAVKNLIDKIETLYLEYTQNDYVKEIIHPAIVQKTKRTEAGFVNVDVPQNVPIKNWKAVHDIMDYGDIEETIYRELFEDGYIRIEIQLPDKNGVIKSSGKVYYITDPNEIKQPKVSVEDVLKGYGGDDEEDILNSLIRNDCINIKQSAWLEYNNMLGNNVTY